MIFVICIDNKERMFYTILIVNNKDLSEFIQTVMAIPLKWTGLYTYQQIQHRKGLNLKRRTLKVILHIWNI